MDQDLLRDIRNAFPAGHPPERPVTGHRCPECDEVDHLLGGRLWSEVADAFPQYCCDTYPLLTPAAQVYYLPAYMCHAVHSPETVAGASIFAYLENGALPRDAFTPAQRAAILQWIKWYCRDDLGGCPSESAVSYWRDG
jgi:hypothetical protein